MSFHISHIKYLFFHPLSKNRLFITALRYIYFHIFYRNNKKVIIPFLNKKLVIIKGHGENSNYFIQIKDYYEMLFLIHFLKDNDIFVDVGAHIGAYSILAGITSKVKVHSFEPNMSSYKVLEENIKLNNLEDRFTTYNIALGEKKSFVQIVQNGSCTHINKDELYNLQDVKMKRLDDIIYDANILKIDVEGYEENVLKGAKNILRSTQLNAIIIELTKNNIYNSSIHKVHNLLQSFGFNPYNYNPINRQLEKRSDYKIVGKKWWNIIYIKDFDLVSKRIRSAKKIKIYKYWY